MSTISIGMSYLFHYNNTFFSSCFGNPSMEGILDALQSDGSKWARDQLKVLL